MIPLAMEPSQITSVHDDMREECGPRGEHQNNVMSFRIQAVCSPCHDD